MAPGSYSRKGNTFVISSRAFTHWDGEEPAHSLRLTIESDRLTTLTNKRNGQALSIEHHCIDRELMIKAKRRQITVWAWTPDSEAQWARLIEAGIDGIITNVPHQLRAYMDKL